MTSNMLPVSVLSGFGMELILALSLITIIMWRRKMPKWASRATETVPVCDNPSCKEIEEAMVEFMKKELAFDETELEQQRKVVEENLKNSVAYHRSNEVYEGDERKNENSRRNVMLQCLRTNLVKHPDDLRGRRRANVAREILNNYVYEEPDCFFHIGQFFDCIGKGLWNSLASLFNCCLPKCMLIKNAKKLFKTTVSQIEVVFSLMKAFVVWLADVHSDMLIIRAVFYCYTEVLKILDFLRVEETPTEAVIQTNITDLQPLTFTNGTDLQPSAYTNLLKSCSITDDSKLKSELELLQNILYKYLVQLLGVFVGTFCVQIVRAIGWSQIYWKTGQCWNSFLVLRVPIDMWRVRMDLEDPNKEEIDDSSKFKTEISEHRTRNMFKIIEAFIESLSSCKVQLSFYLFFSFFVGTREEYKEVDCIAQTLLDTDFSIFTFKKRDWHHLPILAYSAMMSLISITVAQYSYYTTRHEFDMSKLGRLTYLLSSLLATFTKIGGHVMFQTVYLIAVIDPENSDSQFIISFLPSVAIFWLQLQIGSIVDWWKTSEGGAGYSLFPISGLIWPTTANTSLEIRRNWAIKRPTEGIQVYGVKAANESWGCLRRSWRTLCKLVFCRCTNQEKTKLWYSNFCFPWMGMRSAIRLNDHPHKFGFDNSEVSRKKYQERFAFTLGLTFGLSLLKMVIALIIIVALGIDLTKQLATENAIYVWLSIIPVQFLALLLLYFFYEHCHVWKKGGVSVGYMYKESEENQENEVERPIEKQRFEGTWVSHSTEDAVTQAVVNSDVESQEMEHLLPQTSVNMDEGSRDQQPTDHTAATEESTGQRT